jgi:hypothetical protein
LHPSLVWNGSEYGVAWAYTLGGNDEIYLARLDATGVVIGTELNVSAAAGASRAPSLLWTGSMYAVAWMDDRDGNMEIYAATITPPATIVGPVRVTTASNMSVNPSLGWSGASLGVAWQDDRAGSNAIYFVQLSQLLERLGPDVLLSPGEGPVSLEWAGDGYGVAFRQDVVLFLTIDEAGAALRPAAVVSDDTRDFGFGRIALAPGPMEYGVAYRREDIVIQRVSPDGRVIGVPSRIGPRTGWGPALVWANDAYAVAWHDHRSGFYEIYFTRIFL